jgi:uncharacterized protein (TIGR03435 family)
MKSLLPLLLIPALAHAQIAKPAFDVASVRASQQQVGPDYNNQVTSTPAGYTGHNVTLKRLVADAYRCQLNQVTGPPWLDRNEYDVEARMPEGTNKEQTALMLRSLLSDRFHLKQHSESRAMRVYELTAGPGGAKIHSVQSGNAALAGQGLHFHGDLHQFADLLTVQFSIPAAEDPTKPVRAGGDPIPVLDKTGLTGVYDFTVDIKPEMGTDLFTAWKRVLEEDLGLKIESKKADVPVVVVDDALKMPTEN